MHGCHTYKEIPSTFKIWQVSYNDLATKNYFSLAHTSFDVHNFHNCTLNCMHETSCVWIHTTFECVFPEWMGVTLNLAVSYNQWSGHQELLFVDTHTFWFSHISCSYSLLLQCWEKQPEERPRFNELVITIATMLEAVGGYLVLNDTNRKNFASDTHFMYYNWHG